MITRLPDDRQKARTIAKYIAAAIIARNTLPTRLGMMRMNSYFVFVNAWWENACVTVLLELACARRRKCYNCRKLPPFSEIPTKPQLIGAGGI